MAQQAQGQFGYRTVQLIKMEPLGTRSHEAVKQLEYQTVRLLKTEMLGTGSYGTVYKAMCDDLPCAGKILHPTLFQSNDPGAMTIKKRFQRECSFLSEIRHPNIVQYLGLYQDPETQQQVLLMELMDDNLTRFLEQSREPLPYHTQVNICQDVALALAYLHSNDIIHRDLSSNNVLLIGAGNRAKITDFGMAKFFNQTSMTPLTMCPGTEVYMSPEALDNPPVYTKKLDTFSFGVLAIQIITRQFPKPGPRMKKVRDPRDPKRKLQEVVPETERRKSHTDLIDSTHPLLLTAIDCLNDNEEKRPSAPELCHSLAALKQAPQYGDSLQQAQERSRPTENTQAGRKDREMQVREPQQKKEEFNQQIQDLQHQLQGQVREKDTVIATREQKIQQLEQVTREKDHDIEARERQLRELNQKLVAYEQMAAQLQQNLQQKKNMIQKLQEENSNLCQESNKVSLTMTPKGKLTLKWEKCKPCTCETELRKGSAIARDNMAYFRPAFTGKVYSYNSDTEEWSTLQECDREYFTLTVVNGLVTAVGGWQSDNYINTLLSLSQDKTNWKELFPPMPTKRKLTAVVCTEKALVVAGGEGEGKARLATVEVMDTDTLQWSTVSSLPQPLYQASATVCGDRVYLVGGYRWDNQSTKSVFTCLLSDLLQSQTKVWKKIKDLPMEHSPCVTLNGQVLAVGGEDSDKKDSDKKVTDNIYSYNTKENSWEVISHMPTRRSWCLATVLPGNKLMVVGAQTGSQDTNKVEIATAHYEN